MPDIDSHPQAKSFAVNSKLVSPGCCFFALKGEKSDGHNFLKEAAEKGALEAVVLESYQGPDFGLKLIRSKNPLEELHKWAQKKVAEAKLPKLKIIGVTGSVGKTTTKEFLAALLAEKYQVLKTLKSHNSQTGLPLSILHMKLQNADIAILEMGISQKGEMQRLSEIAKADIAIMTNVALVHAANFKNKKEIFEEKSKIFGPQTKVKIINFELLKFFKKDIQDQTFVTFSLKNTEADFFLKIEKPKKNKTLGFQNDPGCRLVFFEKGQKVAAFSSKELFEEKHLLENFLAAFAAARKLDMDIPKIRARFGFLKNAEMRFEKVFQNGICFIKDCYNSNEKSAIAALENLPKVKGKKIAVLGAMKELGKFSKKCHQRVGKKAFQTVDLLLCIGEESKIMAEAFKNAQNLKNKADRPKKEVLCFQDIETLAEVLKKKMQKDDLVLVKGSRSLQLERLFQILF